MGEPLPVMVDPLKWAKVKELCENMDDSTIVDTMANELLARYGVSV